jgi:predicted small secreted protein
MQKNIILLLAIILCGCARTLKYAGRDFQSSGSLCADAIYTNIDASGCDSVYIGVLPYPAGETPRGIKMRCTDYNPDIINEWTMGSFYIIAHRYHNNMFIDYDYKWVCEDKIIVVYSTLERLSKRD